MSRSNPLGRAAKYVFVTAPAGILGWNLNRHIFLWLRSLWVSAGSPPCPECDTGLMTCDRTSGLPGPADEETQEAGKFLYRWQCHRCAHALVAPPDAAKVREIGNRRRQVRALATLGAMQIEERERLARSHRLNSRIWYLAALGTLCGAIYLLASGASLMTAATWGSFSFTCGVMGLKRAFRAWQVTSGRLFQAGAFWFWFKHSKWLV